METVLDHQKRLSQLKLLVIWLKDDTRTVPQFLLSSVFFTSIRDQKFLKPQIIRSLCNIRLSMWCWWTGKTKGLKYLILNMDGSFNEL